MRDSWPTDVSSVILRPYQTSHLLIFKQKENTQTTSCKSLLLLFDPLLEDLVTVQHHTLVAAVLVLPLHVPHTRLFTPYPYTDTPLSRPTLRLGSSDRSTTNTTSTTCQSVIGFFLSSVSLLVSLVHLPRMCRTIMGHTFYHKLNVEAFPTRENLPVFLFLTLLQRLPHGLHNFRHTFKCCIWLL